MAMRTCRTCKADKPLMDFYQQTNGNLFRECKECTKARVRRNRLANIDYYREYERDRANLPHRVEARKQYQQTPEGRTAGNRAKRVYKQRNPAKDRAHYLCCNAIRDGRLIRQPCEKCGSVAQAHHDDYSKPLEVRWLCPKHHAEWHRHNTPICPDQEKAA